MSPDHLIILRRRPFVKAVAAAMRDRCGIERGDHILVAVSGGADSVALLRTLHALAAQPHWSLKLYVGHVNHHLRDEADEEERFVGELARSLDMPFVRADIDPAKAGGNLEAAARRMRYAALSQLAAKAGASFIATAHHADDQLETMLMRLIRGASAEGLAGMAWRRRLDARCDLIRPMLAVDHAGAVAVLNDLDQGWCEDVTNLNERWRARLRAQVLSVLKQLRPAAAANAARTADQLREVAKLLRRRVRAVTHRDVHFEDGVAILPRDIARRMPNPLLGGVIRQQARRLGAPADALGAAVLRPVVRAIRDASGEVRTFPLAGGVTVTVTADAVTLCAV